MNNNDKFKYNFVDEIKDREVKFEKFSIEQTMKKK